MEISFALVLSVALFVIGAIGVLSRRNAVVLFLSIEMMFNSVNFLFVAFSYLWGNPIGLMWVFFVLIVSAAEAAVGLAIIIQLFRSQKSVDVDQYNQLRG